MEGEQRKELQGVPSPGRNLRSPKPNELGRRRGSERAGTYPGPHSEEADGQASDRSVTLSLEGAHAGRTWWPRGGAGRGVRDLGISRGARDPEDSKMTQEP